MAESFRPDHKSYGHPKIVKPRSRGYRHRPIVAFTATGGCVDEYGQVIDDPIAFAKESDTHLWVTYDVPALVIALLDTYGDDPAFSMGGTGVAPPTYDNDKIGREARLVRAMEVRPEDAARIEADKKVTAAVAKYDAVRTRDSSDEREDDNRKKRRTGGYIETVKPTTFGFRQEGKRRRARHIIINPANYTGGESVARLAIPNTTAALVMWAVGLRKWCRSNDLPIGKSLSSLGSSLSRDPRFWPDMRGRVPTKTNESVRPYLPGALVKCNDQYSHHRSVLTLDQRRAYHTIATQTVLPDPSTLYARGYFHSPDDSTKRLWTTPGKPVYERTVRQPGLYAMLISVGYGSGDKPCLPYLRDKGERIVYVWSPELRELQADPRVIILGLTAAWTARKAEKGLAEYGAWALSQIDENEDIAVWLKPSLHSMYGLLAARPTTIVRAELRGSGEDYPLYYAGRKLDMKAKLIPYTSPVTNVCVLGVLQAELRVRTLEMACILKEAGANILRIHSDGIHFQIAQLPTFNDAIWKLEEITGVHYYDDVTYVCDQRIVAPGRSGTADERLRRLLERRTNPAGKTHVELSEIAARQREPKLQAKRVRAREIRRRLVAAAGGDHAAEVEADAYMKGYGETTYPHRSELPSDRV